jgi:hypothetical protein
MTYWWSSCALLCSVRTNSGRWPQFLWRSQTKEGGRGGSKECSVTFWFSNATCHLARIIKLSCMQHVNSQWNRSHCVVISLELVPSTFMLQFHAELWRQFDFSQFVQFSEIESLVWTCLCSVMKYASVAFVENSTENLVSCYIKLNSVALVRERTMPTERPPLVGEVSANFCG